MTELIIFAVGIAAGYLLCYLPYRDIRIQNEELRGRENFRIGYRPPEQKASPEAPKEQQRTSEPIPDLLALQQAAYDEE